MHLARFARLSLAHLPTPLERLDTLTRELGGPEIWIKRDDCTGLSTGGNKTRKLEFLMAEAQTEGADVMLIQGAKQSNHARQTAASATKLGMACHLLQTCADVRLDTPNCSGRMDNLRAAILRPQLADLDRNVERWNERYDALEAELSR